jgi:transcriptional regulator with XRE-family HTH domain
MQIQKIFGKNVRKYREKLSWSQERLAEEAGFHRTYISGVELGKRNPTIKVANSIAKALKVPVAKFFEVGFLDK